MPLSPAVPNEKMCIRDSNNQGTDNTQNSDNPDTSDADNMIFLSAIVLSSFSALAVIYTNLKKKETWQNHK